ncbi:MAG: glutamate--tRNA ligase [Solirubrobacteraceae bacterium]
MRLRFAPSPTGALHIGGARTALFNSLLAKGSGGTLVLRIEDTDRERSTPENVQQILDALGWLKIDWDEGPTFQSERAERHAHALAQLLDGGHAYRSTATAEDVKAYKEEHGADRGFRGKRGAPGAEGAVRLHVPDEGATVVHDVIRGDAVFEHVHLDDPVIARADGSVLYNFAVAIDDLDARITHVVRGEDHLSNTPKQLLVLSALGAPAPVYAHLPLLHGPDGRKLSKRDGAASVQELRDGGYVPEAVCNYIALLGWGSPDDDTVMSVEELQRAFSLERVSRNPARFDEVKLRWMNGVYIRSMPVAELAERIAGFAEARSTQAGSTEAGFAEARSAQAGSAEARSAQACDAAAAEALSANPQRLERAVAISQEKIGTLADFWPLCSFLFAERELERSAAERWLSGHSVEVAAQIRNALGSIAEQRFDVEHVQAALEALVERLDVKPREVYQPLRVAIAGGTVSPGIFESVALLGRRRTLARLDEALHERA